MIFFAASTGVSGLSWFDNEEDRDAWCIINEGWPVPVERVDPDLVRAIEKGEA